MGSGGGGGGGVNWNYNYIHYAPYIESKHRDFLNTMLAKRNAVIDDSPFAGYTDVIVDPAFFGGGYLIGNFPSLYDMFGKFMAGLDIEVLWGQLFEGTVNPIEVTRLVTAESALLDDEIETTMLPRLKTGMRDINAVQTSSFIVAKAMIEATKVKALNKFSAEIRYRLIPVAQERWATHLNWNQGVITTYAEMMKLYYSTKMDIDEVNYSMAAKDKLWPFTVLDFERAGLGALQGATTSQQGVAGASRTQKAIGGALAGAASGAMIGASLTTPIPFIGAAIGGAFGLAASLF